MPGVLDIVNKVEELISRFVAQEATEHLDSNRECWTVRYTRTSIMAAEITLPIVL